MSNFKITTENLTFTADELKVHLRSGSLCQQLGRLSFVSFVSLFFTNFGHPIDIVFLILRFQAK